MSSFVQHKRWSFYKVCHKEYRSGEQKKYCIHTVQHIGRPFIKFVTKNTGVEGKRNTVYILYSIKGRHFIKFATKNIGVESNRNTVYILYSI